MTAATLVHYDLAMIRALATIAIALACAPAQAAFEVIEPWVRPAAASQRTEGYMQLRSSEGAVLIGARCRDAATTSLVNAKGRVVDYLALPSGTTVSLAPTRTRLVLTGLSRTIAQGDRFACSLMVQARDGTAQEIAIDAEVRRRSAREDHHTH